MRWFLVPAGPPIAFTAVSTSGQVYKPLAAAGPIDGERWRLLSANPLDSEPERQDIDVSGLEDVVGILGTALGPALVICDADRRALYAVSQRGRTLLVRMPEAITNVAVCYHASLIAYVVAKIELRLLQVQG